MKNFVLVHGGRHGGWCWKKIVPLLRRAGHEVFTPTLTGLGEKKHLAHPGVNLETHIQDVLGVIEYEDLRDVILVGHSYAGMVVTGVADTVPECIAQLVYLDAVVPRAGERLVDLVGGPLAQRFTEWVRIHGEGWKVPPLTPPEDFGIVKPEDIAWAGPRLTAQPYGTYTQPLKLTGRVKGVSTSFIQCTGAAGSAPRREPKGAGPGLGMERAKEAGWPITTIPTGHDVMISEPEALVKLLLAGLPQAS